MEASTLVYLSRSEAKTSLATTKGTLFYISRVAVIIMVNGNKRSSIDLLVSQLLS